ncbi:hypothetical protein [Kitasatospora sp. LaBMicrA B282]|uniref:hypothetical protein n=1 Tax=Kitasatospora sp. LaBMicrA B282 TaxID=3420949 RepID=UPI003D112D37
MLAALSVSALSGDADAAVVDGLVDRALRGGLAGTDESQMLLSLARGWPSWPRTGSRTRRRGSTGSPMWPGAGAPSWRCWRR